MAEPDVLLTVAGVAFVKIVAPSIGGTSRIRSTG